MAGMPLTGRGGQFDGGAQYGWGDAPGGGAQSANSGLNRGRYTNSPEAGLHRGEWQWRGHGPSAQQSYGWDYQGGVGRDETTQHTEARMGSSFQARMAQERSGGLPQGRYAIDYDQGRRTGGHGGQDVSYDWGWEGHGGQQGGMQQRETSARYGATSQRYGGDYRAGGYAGSGAGYSGGHPQGRGGYGRERGFGEGMRAGGGYGAQNYDRGTRGRMGGGYDGPYQQPLNDADFYRRVERW